MAFSGFPNGGGAFFAQLASTQDRDWFKAHKAEYLRLWEAPMKALFEALHATLRGRFPKVGAPKHLRIYRDVRFSKDKAPFKTEIAASLPLFGGDALMGCGLYASFGRENLVAAGRWMMDGAELARYRKALAGAGGAAFAKGVAKAKQAGYEVMVHQALKRVPPPYPAEHARAELLKLKGFALGFPKLPGSALADAALVDRIVKQTKAVAPLLKWVEAAATGKK